MEAGTTVQITMPEMGESVTEGTIIEWLKQVGDEVEADEGIVEVSTDKVDAVVPDMGESVTEGTVLEWLKQVGDRVEVGDGLVEISTDKVDAELPAPVAGTIAEILVEPDQTVSPGTVVCRIAPGAGAER